MRYDRAYFVAFALVLAIESSIALFVHDAFVRPYVGDALVVPLLYLLVRTFYVGSARRILLSVFGFACLVELAQYWGVFSYFGLGRNAAARVIFGATFDWLDILAYGVGAVSMLTIEDLRTRFKNARDSLNPD